MVSWRIGDSLLLWSDVKVQRGFAARSQLPGSSLQLRRSVYDERCTVSAVPTWQGETMLKLHGHP
jgi:hypothetical protein